MSSRYPLLAAALLAVAGVAVAQPTTTTPSTTAPKAIEPAKKDATSDATLKVGSKAPTIKADKWVKGSEVKSFESGKVYVVEFWATWCPPCRESIPLLTELAKSHKDVTVIGMASSERKAKNAVTDNRADVVEKFVKDKGSEMDYTVAYDATGAMGKSWLHAAGQNGIPCAFVVGGDGRITYIGNPLGHEELTAAVDAALKAASSTAAKTDPKTPASTTPSKPQQTKPTH